jgi:hypothetical protein
LRFITGLLALALGPALGHSRRGLSHDANRTEGDVLKMIVDRVGGGGATGAERIHRIRRLISVHIARPRFGPRCSDNTLDTG